MPKCVRSIKTSFLKEHVGFGLWSGNQYAIPQSVNIVDKVEVALAAASPVPIYNYVALSDTADLEEV